MENLKETIMKRLNVSEEQFIEMVQKEKDKIDNPTFKYANLTLEEAKVLKQKELKYHYKKDLVGDITSSLLGTDNNNIIFGYREIDQLNYSKRANSLALDSTITSFQMGTVSHDIVTLTKNDFITFMRDAEIHEMTLYSKYANLRNQIDNAISIEDVQLIVW